MKTLSIEEVQKLRSDLEARKPQQMDRDKKVREELQKTNATIKMLERRTRTLSFDLDLGGGDKIAIRSHLSPSEIDRMNEIMNQRGRLQSTIKSLIESHDENKEDMLKECSDIFDSLWIEIISIITADPTITSDWLRENGDLLSKEDMLTMYLGYVEGQKKIAKDRESMVIQIADFRKDG